MLSLLRAIPGADVGKLTTIEAGSEAVDPSTITVEPTLCFIDGEHTDRAALRDAMFCAAVAPRSIIAFHDRCAVKRAICAFMRVTDGYGHPLPDSMFVVDLAGRRRLDSADRLPWHWRAANALGLAGEAEALGPILRRAIGQRRSQT